MQYATEDNAGRIYVNLTGGEAVMPPYSSHHYPGQQQPQQQDEVEQVVNAERPIIRKIGKSCCVVM